jgi:uncharacterized protein with FMN-binding domain
MKSIARIAALSLSAAAFFAAIGMAQASDWFGLSPFGSAAGQPQANAAQAAGDTAGAQVAARKVNVQDGNFVGPSCDAYYGVVQVQANVQGGRLVSVDTLDFPNHRSTSRAINRQALPMLQTEVIRAQGTRVNIISGATLTSRAYLCSLSGAIKKALS